MTTTEPIPPSHHEQPANPNLPPKDTIEAAIEQIDAAVCYTEDLAAMSHEASLTVLAINNTKEFSDSPLADQLSNLPRAQVAQLQKFGQQLMQLPQVVALSEEAFESKIKKDQATMQMVKNLVIEGEPSSDEVLETVGTSMQLIADLQKLDTKLGRQSDVDFQTMRSYHERFHSLTKTKLTPREADIVAGLSHRHLARALEKSHNIVPAESGIQATLVIAGTWGAFDNRVDLMNSSDHIISNDTARKLAKVTPRMSEGMDVIKSLCKRFIAREDEFISSQFEGTAEEIGGEVRNALDLIDQYALSGAEPQEIASLNESIFTLVERITASATTVYGRHFPAELNWLGGDRPGKGMLQATQTIEAPFPSAAAIEEMKARQTTLRQPYVAGKALREIEGGKEFSHLLAKDAPNAHGKPTFRRGELTEGRASGLPRLLTNLAKRINQMGVKNAATAEATVFAKLREAVENELDLATQLQQAGDNSAESKVVLGDLIEFVVASQAELQTLPMSKPVKTMLDRLIVEFSAKTA